MPTIRRLTNPSVEPVSMAEAKRELRIPASDTSFDLLIQEKLASAREAVENFTGRVFGVCSWRYVSDSWGGSVAPLHRTPLVSITSVKYWPADGSAQVSLTGFSAITDTEPGHILFPASLPDLYARPDAVTVEFTAGELADKTPEQIKSAIRYLVSHYFDQSAPLNIGNIANELPFGLRAILESHRVGGFVA